MTAPPVPASESLSAWSNIAAIVTMTFGFATLILLTVEPYRNAPPIPARTVNPVGAVVFTSDDIAARQQVFLKLGEAPSPKVGAFYDKAMAIASLGERMTFLNRGQSWVVRKLREILPRVHDDQLHTDLSDMLRSHEVNITLTNDVTGRTS